MSSIFRVAADGLSRERWDYEVGGGYRAFGIRFTFYGIERRKLPRGRFSAAKSQDRWSANDERNYTSGLPRPTTIPADVVEEAWASVGRDTYIGWFSEEHKLPAIADRSAKRRDFLGSVHESGGAEGNRTNSVGHLLHKRSD